MKNKKISLNSEKNIWHIHNKPLMAKKFNNICQKCNTKTTKLTGVIHHVQYTGFDYKKSLDILLADNALQWICKTCHKKEHTAISREQVTRKIKHSGFCAICNQFSWHSWYRMSNDIIENSFPICNSCLNLLTKNKILLIISNQTINQYNWNKVSSLSKESKKLLKLIVPKINRKEFGSIDQLDDKLAKQCIIEFQ